MLRDDATPQQIAYAYLRDGILTGRLRAGDWLKAEAIAQELAISRMPVRDALRQLDSEGLVTIRLNRGATVTNLTLEDILELFEIRSVLEGLAAGLAARRASPEGTAELNFLIAEMELSKPERQRWMERHDAVHDHLCALSGRAELCEQIRRLRARVRPYLLIYSFTHGDPELPGYEHSRFIEPLETGDAAAAERIVRAHIMANAESIMADLSRTVALGTAGDAAPKQIGDRRAGR